MIQENARVSISVCALTFFYLSQFFFSEKGETKALIFNPLSFFFLLTKKESLFSDAVQIIYHGEKIHTWKNSEVALCLNKEEGNPLKRKLEKRKHLENGCSQDLDQDWFAYQIILLRRRLTFGVLERL